MIAHKDYYENGSRPGKVLVVDNEKLVRSAFKRVLEISLPGTVVDEAENGAEAVRAVLGDDYDVVLMDVHMPVMDGEVAFDAITEVCKEKNARMPSVIFCTGYLASQHVKEIVEGDPSHRLFLKPISSDAMIEAVRNRVPQEIQ